MPRPVNMTDAQMVAWMETQYDLNENGCWVWKKSRSNGYGYIKWKQNSYGVHKLYWLLSGRVIPEGLMLCHGPCHNRACFNPEHLTPGTNAENSADKVRDGTDDRGEKNANAKLTAEQVLAIRANLENKTQKELGKEYGVVQGIISAIVNRKRWAHI